MQEKLFFDPHCHAMNLSHPNLSAFIRRLHIPFVMTLFAPFISLFMGKEINRVKNLLSVMENNLGGFFLLMEEDLTKDDSSWAKHGKDRRLTIGGRQYDKVVLTPLMMDFGFKNMSDPEIYYSRLADKPIVDQVTDLFNGIKRYQQDSHTRLFEIYPFLGINTGNYSLKKIQIMLDKYFRDYDGSYWKLHDNLPKYQEFDGNIDTLGSNYFAGIKLYPPLGFDPWPEDNAAELEKVKYLYGYCVSKAIPVTVHCSDGGFIVGSPGKSEVRTSPERWETVLEEYPELKINFAHFGKNSKLKNFFHKEKWTDKIIEFIIKYENVYTDFSCSAFGDKFYEELSKKVKEHSGTANNKLEDRILFGSDFMINLLYINSYSKYIKLFSETERLTDKQKEKFCNENVERFLFTA